MGTRLVASALLTVLAAAFVDRIADRPRTAAFARVAVALGWSGSVGIAVAALLLVGQVWALSTDRSRSMQSPVAVAVVELTTP